MGNGRSNEGNSRMTLIFPASPNDRDLNVSASSRINFTQNEDICFTSQRMSGAKDQSEKMILKSTISKKNTEFNENEILFLEREKCHSKPV